jgi:hypothetical protein
MLLSFFFSPSHFASPLYIIALFFPDLQRWSMWRIVLLRHHGHHGHLSCYSRAGLVGVVKMRGISGWTSIFFIFSLLRWVHKISGAFNLRGGTKRGAEQWAFF